MKTYFPPSLASLVALLLGGCAAVGPTGGRPVALTPSSPAGETRAPDAELLQPSEKAFTLGPGDRLEIEIAGDPTSRAATLVGPDGKIYYQVLPGIDVWGLTLAQTREALEHRL